MKPEPIDEAISIASDFGEMAYTALTELATVKTENALLRDVLSYFVGYHTCGIGQLTHALARAETALSSTGEELKEKDA